MKNDRAPAQEGQAPDLSPALKPRGIDAVPNAVIVHEAMKDEGTQQGDSLDQAERLQAEEAQALEARLTGSVVALGQELGKAAEALGQQKRWLGQLQADQEVLGKLHDHLAKVGGHHEDMIRELGAETRQQLRISRTHIDGLHALYREQHGELQKLAADHALLDEKSRVLAEQLQGLNAVVADHATQTGRRLRRLGGAVAVLAVVSLGLIAWFQFKPTAVPESVTIRLAGLSAGLQGQTSRSGAMGADLAQVHQGMAVLAQQMQDQASAMAGLRAESHRTGREMQSARVALTALTSQVGTLQGQVQSMRPDVTESGRPDGAAASR